MASEPVIVNLTRGRLGVYVNGQRVWVGMQSQWADARKVVEAYTDWERVQ